MNRFAKELVALQPDLILTSSTPATAVMLQQTRTIPVIFVLVADPVGSGFVTSLARPGGNVTGFTPIVGSLGGKWVELLKRDCAARRQGHLVVQPANGDICRRLSDPSEPPLRPSAWRRLSRPLTTCPSLKPSFPTQAREPNSGLVVIPDVFTVGHRAEIISLAARFRVPAIYWSRSFAEIGGLISYGPFISSMSTGVRRRMPIASSRAQNQVSFPFRRPPSSSW